MLTRAHLAGESERGRITPLQPYEMSPTVDRYHSPERRNTLVAELRRWRGSIGPRWKRPAMWLRCAECYGDTAYYVHRFLAAVAKDTDEAIANRDAIELQETLKAERFYHRERQ